MPPLLLADDDDDCPSVSMTWAGGSGETILHRPTGARMSPESGIEVEGQTYSLRKDDIEIVKKLGQGAGGVVSLAVYKPTGARIAVKAMRVNTKELKQQML